MTAPDPLTVALASVAELGEFFVDCRVVGGGIRWSVNADRVVPIASMYKVLLALEVADRMAADPAYGRARLTIDPTEHSPAGDGITRLADPITLSRRDLLLLSLAWSDNTASDRLLDDVGADAVRARARRLGLTGFELVGSCATLLHLAGEDLGYPNDAEAEAADWAPRSDAADLVLERTTRASAAELSTLAEHLALGTAASPAACELVRAAMAAQVWRTRLGSAISEPAWARETKTGTLPPWRGEFGLVTRDGVTLALTVVLRQQRIDLDPLELDLAIGRVGEAASAAVLARAGGGAS